MNPIRRIRHELNKTKYRLRSLTTPVPEPTHKFNYLIQHQSKAQLNIRSKEIPKIIWTYWEGSSMPLFVKNCLDNIRNHNNDFQLITITPSTIDRYIQSFPHSIIFSSVQAKADLVRLAVLKDNGGIWLDASSALSQSLNWILALQAEHKVEFVGFYNPTFMNSNVPYIENWFLAAVPGAIFIVDWYDEYLKAASNASMKNYYKNDPQYGLMKQHLPHYFEDYLIMHLAAQKILLNNEYSILTINCTQEGLFYRYNTKPAEEPLQYANFLLRKKQPKTISKLIKFTGGDRNAIEAYLVSNKVINGSILNNLKIVN